MKRSDPLILLTGATGYVGRELLHLLERIGRRTRCMVRRPGTLTGRVATSTEVVIGDALQGSSLQPARQGVDTAYSRVHSFILSRIMQNIAGAVSNSAANPEPSDRPEDSAQTGRSHAG